MAARSFSSCLHFHLRQHSGLGPPTTCRSTLFYFQHQNNLLSCLLRRWRRVMARYHDTPDRRTATKTDYDRQKYSLYLPLHPKASARKGSVSKYDEKARKERESLASRASVDPATGKRRATMRSKELDDEEEQMRIAIEESKREVAGKTGTGRRNGKRARDDSSEE